MKELIDQLMKIRIRKQVGIPGYMKPSSKPMHPNSLCQKCRVFGANRIVPTEFNERGVPIRAQRRCWQKECSR